MAGPPPPLRDDRLTLEQLGRMAREYDQISRGEHWPATEFVIWLRDEYRATSGTQTSEGYRNVTPEVDEAA